MFIELNHKSAKAIRSSINIILTFGGSWSILSPTWHSVPSFIKGGIGQERIELFSCYSSLYDGNLDICNIESSSWLIEQDDKALTDFYLGYAFAELISFAKDNKYKRILFETYLPTAYDHLLELGFYLVPTQIKIQGYKYLK